MVNEHIHDEVQRLQMSEFMPAPQWNRVSFQLIEKAIN